MRMSWFFGGAGARRAPIIIALLVLINALFLRTVDPVFFSRMRDFAFDSFQRMQPLITRPTRR